MSKDGAVMWALILAVAAVAVVVIGLAGHVD